MEPGISIGSRSQFVKSAAPNSGFVTTIQLPSNMICAWVTHKSDYSAAKAICHAVWFARDRLCQYLKVFIIQEEIYFPFGFQT
jgi:hypothetical protein